MLISQVMPKNIVNPNFSATINPEISHFRLLSDPGKNEIVDYAAGKEPSDLHITDITDISSTDGGMYIKTEGTLNGKEIRIKAPSAYFRNTPSGEFDHEKWHMDVLKAGIKLITDSVKNQ